MGFSSEVCKKLREPLEKFTRQGSGGKFYTYYKGSDVIRRLNDAFGHSWSSERVETSVVEDQILMLVSLSVFAEGDMLVHHGYGSAPVGRHRETGKIVDIGNSYKAAFTNALKKAAEQFGIGLGGDEDEEEKVSSPRQPSGRPRARPPATNGSSSRPPMQRPEPLPVRPTGNGGSTPDIRAAAAAAVGRPVGGGVTATAPRPEASALPDPLPTPDLGDEVLTSTQETALKSLSKLRNIDEEKMVQGALPETNKTTFKELLKSEAIQVIRFANKLPPQG
jgi:hypothetical protein